MDAERINKNELLAGLPPEWPDDLLPEIQKRVRASGHKVVVLDDDPTGTQTVHGVSVLTEWSVEILEDELRQDNSAFYILTNSRSLPLDKAQALNARLGRNLLAAGRRAGRQFVVVSRSDSTLRGHFPGEVEALVKALELDCDGWLLIPFFLEGGRYTINDIHYVVEGDWLVPAGETEFARDAAFGYRASNLHQWVQEKTNGRVSSEQVTSVSLEDLREGGPAQVTTRLLELPHGGVCVVNAASYRDLEVFTLGLLEAEARGKRFVHRTAASMVRVRAGITPHLLLTRDDLHVSSAGGGLVVVGSYIPRSTRQVEALLELPDLVGIEIKVEALLDGDRRAGEIQRVTGQADQALGSGSDVVVYTGGGLIKGADAESSLSVGQRVSSGLVEIVRGISTRPRYLLAKGGITSSDLATGALGVKRGQVLGQILPGVPVWRLGGESRHPDMAYIVFPGNVGGRDALVRVVTDLKRA